MTRQTYVEYIIGTPINYTCTHFADHLTDGISHDAVNDYLRRERHSAHTLWELANPLIDGRNQSSAPRAQATRRSRVG